MRGCRRRVPARRPRVLLVALLAAAIVGTAGCTQLLSINEDALIVGVGLDAGSQPGEVSAVLQWYHHGAPGSAHGASGLGGGSGGGGSARLLTLTATAPDTATAISALRDQTDQAIVFYVTDLLVLGQALAREGVVGPLNYLWRSGQIPETTEVAVAAGRAAHFLETKFPGGTAVEVKRRLVRSQYTDTGSIPIPLWRFLARTTARGKAAWAPIFARTAGGFRADGTALFQGGRLTGEVDQKHTAALSWLLKQGGYGGLVVPATATGTPLALRIISRTLRRTVIDAGDARLDLNLKAALVEGEGVVLQQHDPTWLQQVAAREADAQVWAVLQRLQAAGSDVLGLGELLRRQRPAAVTDWPQQFATMHIDLRVQVRIIPSGRGA